MNYSYIRDSFNPDYPDNNILSIQLSLDGFSFYVADKDSVNRPLYFYYKKLGSPGLNNLYTELKDFHFPVKNNFYRTFSVFHTHEFCLIPEKIYNHGSDHEFMQLSHPLARQSRLHTSEIPLINARVAFHVPDEISEIIDSKFNDAVMLHSVCPAVNFGIMRTGIACLIHNYGTSISVGIFKNRKLLFFNTFSVTDENDLAYYTLSALKTCKVKPSDVRLYLSGSVTANPDDFSVLTRFLSKPLFYSPELQDTDSTEVPSGLLFNHLEGIGCVL